nr:uncharacterized protein LOC105845239 [Hydra vulgaris]XP_047122333.1 uncharacterized protein LOC105845239 [Hydra vulgaris]XP_047122334.1 uncharacterized protein LOC105845239 [Hydra vulgaris]XP_047122335.1 uncharacterized protein LOC105845239 [Hydra vulgaris]XP_047122336.1 uncharacterized protein LOC105845239 [Hydra vulgaris]
MLLNKLASKSKLSNNFKPTFWLYGDSVTKNFFKNLNTTPLCEVFICQNTYTWTYPLTNSDPHTQPFDNKDFNQTEFLYYIKMVLMDPTMMHNDSVLVINFGLHILKNINMSQAEKLFDAFIDMVLDIKSKSLFGFPKILWKSTTPAYVENIFRIYHKRNIERTLVKQRAIQWNLFCVKKMCQVNLPVLDVYWMAASYPQGPYDAVHYDDYVFDAAAEFLVNIFT